MRTKATMHTQSSIVLPLAILLMLVGFFVPYAMLAGAALIVLWAFWLGVDLFLGEGEAFQMFLSALITIAVIAILEFLT